MNRWKVIAVVLVVWGVGLFLLEQATHRRLEGRLAKLQKDNQELQKTVDGMMVTINQLRIVAKNTKNDRAVTNAVVPGQALSAADILTLKTAFDDIQGEVAAGKLKQLALMDAYQKMQKVLNSPTVGAIQSKGGEMPPSK
jgi:hypothetical protein